jgi:type II secretory pathway component HofQ
MFALTVLVLFAVCSVFAASKKIYTNKDLEKYTGKKSSETAVKYTGRKVTLDFNEANLTGVLTLLSDIARRDGYTLTVDTRIQGKITLKMKNVSWDEVLDFLVENYNLVKTVKDKSIMISPPK